MKQSWSKPGVQLFVGVLMAAALAPMEATAFTLIRSGSKVTNIGWQINTVTFDVDTSCNSYLTNVNSAIEAAASLWGAVPDSTLTVARGSTTTLPNAITTYVGASATSYAPSGNAIVYCDTAFSTNSGASADSTPGFATGQNISSSGRIDGCLLVLNVQSGGKANITTLSSTVVNTVLTHEIGHCLGIGHSADEEALMYYNTNSSRQAVLAKDDMDAVAYLYPKQELGDSFLGCSTASVAAWKAPRGGGRPGPLLRALGSDLVWFAALIVFLRLYAIWLRRPKPAPSCV